MLQRTFTTNLSDFVEEIRRSVRLKTFSMAFDSYSDSWSFYCRKRDIARCIALFWALKLTSFKLNSRYYSAGLRVNSYAFLIRRDRFMKVVIISKYSVRVYKMPVVYSDTIADGGRAPGRPCMSRETGTGFHWPHLLINGIQGQTSKQCSLLTGPETKSQEFSIGHRLKATTVLTRYV